MTFFSFCDCALSLFVYFMLYMPIYYVLAFETKDLTCVPIMFSCCVKVN